MQVSIMVIRCLDGRVLLEPEGRERSEMSDHDHQNEPAGNLLGQVNKPTLFEESAPIPVCRVGPHKFAVLEERRHTFQFTVFDEVVDIVERALELAKVHGETQRYNQAFEYIMVDWLITTVGAAPVIPLPETEDQLVASGRERMGLEIEVTGAAGDQTADQNREGTPRGDGRRVTGGSQPTSQVPPKRRTKA